MQIIKDLHGQELEEGDEICYPVNSFLKKGTATRIDKIKKLIILNNNSDAISVTRDFLITRKWFDK